MSGAPPSPGIDERAMRGLTVIDDVLLPSQFYEPSHIQTGEKGLAYAMLLRSFADLVTPSITHGQTGLPSRPVYRQSLIDTARAWFFEEDYGTFPLWRVAGVLGLDVEWLRRLAQRVIDKNHDGRFLFRSEARRSPKVIRAHGKPGYYYRTQLGRGRGRRRREEASA